MALILVGVWFSYHLDLVVDLLMYHRVARAKLLS